MNVVTSRQSNIFLEKLIAMIALASIVFVPNLANGQVGIRPDVNQLADIVEDLLPTVVNVDTRSTISVGGAQFDLPEGQELPRTFREFMERMQPQQRETAGAGSGFIVSDRFIVTNNHVVEGASEVIVTLNDGSQFAAEIWATDPDTDLAVLQIDSGGRDLPEIEWGSSQDLRVGEWLIAIGNPFGFGSTVTAGIVSAKGRSISSGPYDQFIQTDASINRGNSGGPSFNIDGKVVGVNSAIYSPTGASVGIGFAIPSRIAQRVVEDLIVEREVVRGFIGVRIDEISDAIAEELGLERPQGAVVKSVGAGGPADSAGVEPGDVIIEFNSLPVDRVRDLTTAVAETRVGAATTMIVIRDGRPKTLDVTVARRTEERLANLGSSKDQAPDQPTQPTDPLESFGMRVEELNESDLAALGFSQYRTALLVSAIAEDAIFDPRDLQAGDIIVELRGRAPTSAQAFALTLQNEIDNQSKLLPMIVIRNGTRNWIAPQIQK